MVNFHGFPPFPLPGALQSAQTSVLWSFLDISKVAAETERWMSPPRLDVLPPELPTDVCRQPQRPRNPRKPGGVFGFPGQLRTNLFFFFFSCLLLAHVHSWWANLDESCAWICTHGTRATAALHEIRSLRCHQVTERRQLFTCMSVCPRTPRSPQPTYGEPGGSNRIHVRNGNGFMRILVRKTTKSWYSWPDEG